MKSGFDVHAPSRRMIASEKTLLRAAHEPIATRRTMIQAGSLSLLGLGMNHLTALRSCSAESSKAEMLQSSPAGAAKSVIFVFLSGGLAQHDSFDPKPDAPVGIRGEFSSISPKRSMFSARF